MTSFLSDHGLSVKDMCFIPMSCSVDWKVESVDDIVSIWDKKYSQMRENVFMVEPESEIQDECFLLVKGINIERLFHSYDQLYPNDVYDIGICYDTLVACSLAVKYYLQSL
ncbi:hypothetical protein BDEG_23451 [Batrachochytrium dendrobatidis JEL423]|uniref:Uncharacterized protein n=1 Tax=Batrachochytrium dendrobatidis (strain JEL423) TaxID=403673 RepID=A0A177WIJ4_BATDL|nr:hypothetical protein BDEG_23451 [Batrachochytrium dendrobatidis JEL423]